MPILENNRGPMATDISIEPASGQFPIAIDPDACRLISSSPIPREMKSADGPVSSGAPQVNPR